MNQTEPLLSLQCPKHSCQFVTMIDTDLTAKKFVYCSDCIAESDSRGTNPKTIISLESYLEETAKLYEKYRERASKTAGDPPLERLDELSKMKGSLENLSQHINNEKTKVKERFEEIRRITMRIIDEKEKEFLEVFDKKVVDLSALYLQHEKLVFTKWPKPSDIQVRYPKLGVLKERICQIENLDQLRAFIKEAQENIEMGNIQEDDLNKRIKNLESSIIEFCFPKMESRILGSEDVESLMKDFKKEFIRQKGTIGRDVISESKIIHNEQIEILKNWLPKEYKFDSLELLYRGSVDGMMPKMLHEKCDGKGSTITLIKCRFNDVEFSSVIGGFLDENLNASERWTGSKKAFIFSLSENGNSIKCPILEDHSYCAFYGSCQDGPVFGNGNDIFVARDFQHGSVAQRAYLGAEKLCPGKSVSFVAEDIEVFLVQGSV